MPYGALVALWPYALLEQMIEQRIKTGQWEIDWPIHSVGAICAVAGVAIIPLIRFVGWWAGWTAFGVYVLPIAIVVAVISVIVYLERDETAELEYDAAWCKPHGRH